MKRAAKHLKQSHAGGLPLRPGGRKTSITLEAFCELRAEGRAQTMLVIAPLRVCRQTWRQEAAKWTQFKDLKFVLLHGPKKDERLAEGLRDGADIYLLNPEGCDWLSKKYFGRSLPFDIVTIDELTRFKNSQADRCKALRPRLKGVSYRWGLTGSLVPNGYMDLFGQMLMLDDGAALGRYITHYRDQYFQLGFDGFTYKLLPGAEKRIVDRIAPYWFAMDDADYAQLPPLVDVPHELELEPAQRKLYERMKKAMIAELPEGIVTASNSASCYSKLAQMANGAVYVGDNKQAVSHIHDLKLDAIEDLLEELNGEPLLVAYEFNHDFDRLRERFGVLDPKTGRKALPYLGKGTSAADEDRWIRMWNKGELPMLCAHPASAGHGLNMQGASAANVCWFGIPWDYELYDQFIRRIRRDGTQALQIFNHLLIVKGTIDELKLLALAGKDLTQSGLMRALNAEIRRDADTVAAPADAAHERSETMVAKLTRPGGAGQVQTQQETAPSGEVKPKGWGGRPAGAQSDVEDHAPATQRERIQEQISADAPAPARTGFGRRTEAAADAIRNGEQEQAQEAQPEAEAPKPTRTRAPRTPAAEPATERNVPDLAQLTDLVLNAAGLASASNARLAAARVEVLKIAFADPAMELADGLEIADALWKWASPAPF
jgi:hypothetical protein